MAGPGVVRKDNFFSLTGVAEDWTPEQIFGYAGPTGEIKISRIELRGGTGGKGGAVDRVVIKQGGASGPIITTLATPSPEVVDRVYFGVGEDDEEGQYMKPFIDYSESHFNTGHVLVFEVA